MLQKLKALWASLPHQVQAAIVTFAAAAGASIAHALEDGNMTFSMVSVKHLLGTAIVAGVIALRAFYMFPNRGVNSAQLQQQLPPGANR